MCKTTGKLKILLVGASPLLEAEAKDLEHPAIVFVTADPARVAASQEAARDCDVVVVNLDISAASICSPISASGLARVR
jgi:hypothetical protein